MGRRRRRSSKPRDERKPSKSGTLVDGRWHWTQPARIPIGRAVQVKPTCENAFFRNEVGVVVAWDPIAGVFEVVFRRNPDGTPFTRYITTEMQRGAIQRAGVKGVGWGKFHADDLQPTHPGVV